MKTVSLLVVALAVRAEAQTSNKCLELTKLRLPGINMVITKAETIRADDSSPSYCQADGMIDQRMGAGGKTYGIGFAIALPANWNNRFLFQGGGGYNGSVR